MIADQRRDALMETNQRIAAQAMGMHASSPSNIQG